MTTNEINRTMISTIEKLRKEQGLSREALATAAGLQLKTYERLISGNTVKIPLASAKHLCSVLGTTIDSVLGVGGTSDTSIADIERDLSIIESKLVEIKQKIINIKRTQQ